MPTLEELQAANLAAENEAVRLQNEKDAAIQQIIDQYEPQLRQAVANAAQAQKAMCDAEAANALVGREDAQAVATSLGLELPA
jgi:nitric oxide reductase large subunit